MAVNSYTEDGETLFMYSCEVRGKKGFRHLRYTSEKRGLKTQKIAERKEKEAKRKLQFKLDQQIGKGILWVNLLKKWEKHERDERFRRYKDSYINDTLSVIKTWTSTWYYTPVSDLEPGDGADLFNRMDADNKAKSYQKKVKQRINHVIKWGILQRLVSPHVPNPVSWKVFKVEDKMPEILQKGDIGKLLLNAKQSQHSWYPIWFTAVYSGMRTGELQALDWSNVDFEGNVIYVYRSFDPKDSRDKDFGYGPTKGRYWRTVPMNPKLRSFLLSWKKQTTCFKDERDESLAHLEFVFPKLKQWVSGHQAEELRKFCDDFKIPSVCFHTLRACFATHLIRSKKGSDGEIMAVAGWKKLATMQKYIRLSGVDVQGITDDLNFGEEDNSYVANVIQLQRFRK